MKYKKENILIVGDTQFPYDRDDYLDFCDKVRDKYKCGRIIHIGDIADCLNFSFYPKDPSAPSVLEEVEELKIAFEDWEKVFPEMECVVGNHDNRVRRRLDSAGFPEELITTENVFREAFGLPKGWSLHDKIKVKTKSGDVYFFHGDELGSSIVAGQTARKLGASLVRGHHHTQSFLYFISTPHQLIFDMIVGCGIDKDKIAFKYQRKNMARPIFSCGVIENGKPIIVPMSLGKDGKWDGAV